MENRPFVLLAIFFHDIIYNPTASAGKNEDESAAVFEEFAVAANLDIALKERVCEVILQTKTHSRGSSKDANLFLDFDMAVLAWPWERYLAYTQQVRKEYSHIDESAWSRGRSDFLRKSQSTTIFHVLTELEPLAKSNISREYALISR